MLVESDVTTLERVCLDIRKNIIEMVHCAGSGHLGGSLSVVEILVSLYFGAMRIDPKNPKWENRDRLVLSKGHAAPALYAVLAERGYFPKDDLYTFSQPGTHLQKHIDMHLVPGAELSTGSLAQGLSVAVGMALADRIDKMDRYVYAIVGDGEIQEGQIWEAIMAAAHHKASRLIVFLDNNGCQVDGYVKDICSLDPIDQKWRSFGWNVQRINGHNLSQIFNAIRAVKKSTSPSVIIADTIKGKGISFMENNVEWHAKSLSEEEYRLAMIELNR